MHEIMKKFLILMAMICCLHKVFGQETVFDLIDKATKIEASQELNNLYNLVDLDVIQYFNIRGYETELQVAVFKKTEEYKQKLEEVKAEKRKMLKNNYCIVYKGSVTDYDMKKKGIFMELGSNYCMEDADIRTPKSVKKGDGAILFRALPTEWRKDAYIDGIENEYLFFPVGEVTGLEVESARENLQAYFFFAIDGQLTTKVRFYDASLYNPNARGWYKADRRDLKADKVRVVLANQKTGKIFSDKTYTYKAPTANTQDVKK